MIEGVQVLPLLQAHGPGGKTMPLLETYAAWTGGKPIAEAALRPDIIFVSATKGIETVGLMRMSQVIHFHPDDDFKERSSAAVHDPAQRKNFRGAPDNAGFGIVGMDCEDHCLLRFVIST